MPPFHYEAYQNPFVGSIADLIQAPGRAQAQAALTSGQAYGNALANIGTTIGGAVQQATDPRLQLERAQLAQAQQQQGDVKALDAASLPAQGPVQPGQSPALPSRDDILAQLPGHLRATVQKQFDDADESAARVQKARIDAADATAQYFSTLASSVRTHGDDPGAAMMALSHAQDVFKSDPATLAELGKIAQQIQANPTPQTVQMLIAPFIQPQLMKLGEGDTVTDINSNKVVARGGQKPPTEAELAVQAAGGDAKGAMAILKPPPRDGYEQKSVLLDGKPAMVNYDNKTGKSLDATGNDVSARVRPIPPAAIQVQNLTNGQQLPAWATDDSRPAGADGNKFDSSVGMTQNGLYQAAVTWMQTGQFPPTGMGSSPRSQNVRAAITSKVGAIAASSGVDVPTLRAFYKSNSSSLTQQQKFYDSAQAFLTTADKNSALLDGVLPKIPDLGSPLLNVPVRALSQKALGSVDVSQFRTYLTSVQNEYGKILNNPNLSGQLTDSARSEAQQLVSADATAAQVIGSLQALRNEGGNRLQSIGDQIRTIQGRLSNPAGTSPTPAPAPKGRFNPVTGKVEPIQ